MKGELTEFTSRSSESMGTETYSSLITENTSREKNEGEKGGEGTYVAPFLQLSPTALLQGREGNSFTFFVVIGKREAPVPIL